MFTLMQGKGDGGSVLKEKNGREELSESEQTKESSYQHVKQGDFMANFFTF